MAAAIQDFPQWLGSKLQELNADETVFGSYIQGILDGDESSEEKNEALQSILSEFVENEDDISKMCNDILEKWHTYKQEKTIPQQMSSEDVNLKLAKLLESQSLPTTKQREYTEEEKKIRDAILSQYSQTSVDDNECEEDNENCEDMGIQKNLNAQTVANSEKIKREQAKIDSQKKKEKDKEDREKQKQLKEDKKEKRKTTKGERRR